MAAQGLAANRASGGEEIVYSLLCTFIIIMSSIIVTISFVAL